HVSGSCDPKQIFHDTAGWRNLESSLNALQEMIKGSGIHFAGLCDEELVRLILATLQHANRFVRETGFGVCAELVAVGFSGEVCWWQRALGCVLSWWQRASQVRCAGGSGLWDELSDAPLQSQGSLLVQHLALGLADNWSQVRLG
ncbi:hypothetical protein FHG87_025292, partial [Trinorchestia longiramus]